jgi:hypothetical protein
MKLDGFGIAGFRSFGEDIVKIRDLTKVNVFIGKNNSGKSNVLTFCKHLSRMKSGQVYEHFYRELDYNVDCKKKEIRFEIQVKKDSPVGGKIYNTIQTMLPDGDTLFPYWASDIWLEYNLWDRGPGFEVHPNFTELGKLIESKYSESETNELARKHLKHSGGTHRERSNNLARMIWELAYPSFEVHKIGAFRQITGEQSGFSLEGKGLIQELRKAQSPALARYQADKEKFATINKFLQELLGEEDAFLEIPAEPNEIYVSIKGKILPLGSLGTGIHELIILAAGVMLSQEAVFCIEEPEIHIHPELLKKFIRYIQAKTKNQYLISSHSNACFDIPGVNIYHCKLVDGHTTCDLVTTDKDRSGILADLGYKPSDLLQANFVIWVEGPSDRIYVNHWIRGKDPTMVEGLHYSIMFYGGRLLSHLAFDSPDVDEFVQLCRLNRNAAIIIDSDKDSSHSRINHTKKRVVKDFKDNGSFVWLTDGREIENYLSETTLNECISEVHPRMRRHIKWNRFGRLTNIGKNKTIDKVAVARKVAQKNPDYSVLDLDRQINALIESIGRANS